MNPKPAIWTKACSWFLILYLLSGPALAAPIPLRDWVTRFSSGPATDHTPVRDIVRILSTMDSSVVEQTFVELADAGKSAGPLFELRLLHARTWYLQDHNQPYGVEKIVPLLEAMMEKAAATSNPNLVAYASWIYGYMMYSYFELEPAVTYSLNAVDLYAKLPPFPLLHFYYSSVGEMLFHTHEYTKSIRYTKRALELNTDTARPARSLEVKNLNTLAQAYFRLGQPDSSWYYYLASNRLADSIGHTTWKGINAGDMGQWQMARNAYGQAQPLFWYAIAHTRKEEPATAANALQWLARIHIRQGNTDSAAACLNEALRLLDAYGKRNPLQVSLYRRETLATKAELFRRLSLPDSARWYQDRSDALNDSLQRVAILSSSKVALLRIENQKNQYLVKAVLAEKQQETLKRNFLITGILLLAVIALLVINRQRKEMKHRAAMARAEKNHLQAEVAASREKLELFTQNLLEKTSLLEQLQQENRGRQLTSSQLDLVSELSNLTILTEDDWNRFRTMFEQVYPGFFHTLKQSSPDMTVAEQRMAALTRLGLTTRQMAAMLGISLDGVHKTRQRLRQRLQLPADISLEQHVSNLDA